MTLEQMYRLAVELGIKADPRSKTHIQKLLKRKQEKYEKLPKEDKEVYDTADLSNPYSDTRILYGDGKREVKRILAGIDITVGELLLAKKLEEMNGKKIDLVLSHHPMGVALADLQDVMDLQVDMVHKYGVPIHIAENLILPRREEITNSINPINHTQEIDAARLLDMPLMCTHTATDNLVFTYLEKEIQKRAKGFDYVEDLMKFLKTLPEFKEGSKVKAGPFILAGGPARRLGRIALTEMTGGTEGSKEIYDKLSQAGVGTIVGMHMRNEHKDEAKKSHLNVVIAGHMCSDSMGMNLLLDEFEKRGVEVIPCSGLIRIKRFTAKKKPAPKKKAASKKR